MACAICQTRRPKRFCPAVNGAICAICCGTERENTVECPYECPYLQEAHGREDVSHVHPDDFPNRDIEVTDSFIEENEKLLLMVGRELVRASIATRAVDYDARDALDALIRTYRTLESGLHYETVPSGSAAVWLARLMRQGIETARAEARQQSEHILDSAVLRTLVFLQRLELDRNNGRKRGRAFLDFVRGHFPDVRPEAIAEDYSARLIVP